MQSDRRYLGMCGRRRSLEKSPQPLSSTEFLQGPHLEERVGRNRSATHVSDGGTAPSVKAWRCCSMNRQTGPFSMAFPSCVRKAIPLAVLCAMYTRPWTEMTASRPAGLKKLKMGEVPMAFDWRWVGSLQ